MTFFIKISFILYLIFSSFYSGALVHDLEDAIHLSSHSMDQNDSHNKTLATKDFKKSSPEKSNEHDSNDKHTIHQCHTGHFTYLPQVLFFKQKVKEKNIFSRYSDTFKFEYVFGFFKPPRIA